MIKILAIADIHYNSSGEVQENRFIPLGLELLERVLSRISYYQPDVVVLLGDITDDPLEGESAQEDLLKIKKKLDNTLLCPYLVVRGNHDIPQEKFENIFPNFQVYKIKEYSFVIFNDRYYEGETWFNSTRDISKQRAILNSCKNIIALQHSIIHPPMEKPGFNVDESDIIKEDYANYKVLLSLSGHSHIDSILSYKDVNYIILPALVTKPFSYSFITLEKNKVEVKNESLILPMKLWDYHCHTEYAYCANTVNIKEAIRRKEIFELGGLGFCEHSGQLYTSSENFWSARFINEPNIIYKDYKNGKSRINRFIEELSRVKGEDVKVGFEVDCMGDGNISLLEEHRKYADYIIGAVHWIPDNFLRKFDFNIKEAFIYTIKRLLENQIDILAHPYRFFRRHNFPVPTQTYEEVAELLKKYNVAAEINFHTNFPDKEFFRICLKKGVKLALGTDAHSLYEVGELFMHLKLLEDLELSEEEINEVLY